MSYTLIQRSKILSEIQRLRKSGLSSREAIKAVKITPSTYYSWTRVRLKKAKPTFIPLVTPHASPTKMIALVGTPSDVLAALREIQRE